MTADPMAIARDPEWLAHRYVEGKDAVQFVELPREGHRRATFITDEHLPPDLPRVEIGRRDALAQAPDAVPIHFVFHSAFCCSTLIARALDREGVATTLKEPLILNDMVGWRRRRAAGRDVAEATDGALRLLARPFNAGEAVIVKPSNIVNGMARLLLALRPDARALLLYAPLPVFLTSVAKKGIDGRLWVRELFIGFRRDGIVQRLGFDDEAFFGQTDLQIAAAGWLAQQACFADLIQELGPRVRSLDSETLLGRPEEAVSEISDLYGLALSDQNVAEIVGGPFRRNSKNGEVFGREMRKAEYSEAGSVHRDEIEKVTKWAEAVATAANIPLQLPAKLLG